MIICLCCHNWTGVIWTLSVIRTGHCCSRVVEVMGVLVGEASEWCHSAEVSKLAPEPRHACCLSLQIRFYLDTTTLIAVVGFALWWQSGVISTRLVHRAENTYYLAFYVRSLGKIVNILKKEKMRQEKASTRFKLLGFDSGSIISLLCAFGQVLNFSEPQFPHM